MKRRLFVQSSIAAVASSVGLAAHADSKGKGGAGAGPGQKSSPVQVRGYRPLGKTGFEMSDISFGGGALDDPGLVGRALKLGINYFDTAPDYGQSEQTLGRILARYAKRNDVFIASKFCNAVPYQEGVSHLQLPKSKDEYIAVVEGSLKRLQTDHLDVIFVHAMGELPERDRERKRLLDSNMLEAFAALKKAGKARFLAVSSHGPHGLDDLLTTAVDSGNYDIIMPAFNFMDFPTLPKIIARAHGKGVGVIAMKTLAGARKLEPKPAGAVFEHAAFKWVLQHKEVSGLIVTMKSLEQMEGYVRASGVALAPSDLPVLERYARQFGSDYCRTGCGTCEPSCPASIGIATILRYQMYFENYGERERARVLYAQLDGNVDACLTCSSQACNRACPNGLRVSDKLKLAGRQLGVA